MAQRIPRVGQQRAPDGPPELIVGKIGLPHVSTVARESRPAITAEGRVATGPYPSMQRAVPRPVGSRLGGETALIAIGFFAAFVLVALFGVDLICAWPLGRYAPVAEGVFCGCGLLLGYLSWDAYRDLR
jgi:hypothetical protein